MDIAFNKPARFQSDIEYISEVLNQRHLCGNGTLTKQCNTFFTEKYGFKKVLLTTSCTDALEMAAILTGVGPGDEVILPSYTFVSTAIAFLRQGAKLVFADSGSKHPNITPEEIRKHITPKTKVIVPVHYSGVSCDMDAIMDLAHQHGIAVVEDAAQSLDAYYKGKPLGSIGDLGCFSFHDTKNVTSGEGGMLTVNNEAFIRRAEIIWEKGTNRSEFFRGEVNKYGWIDTGSSFLMADLNAALLYSQLQHLEEIQARRIQIWNKYMEALTPFNTEVQLPYIPNYATNNGHIFYMTFKSLEERTAFVSHMRQHGIATPFHYLSLHQSPYAVTHGLNQEILPHADRYTDCLIRLPLFYDMTDDEVAYVIDTATHYFRGR